MTIEPTVLHYDHHLAQSMDYRAPTTHLFSVYSVIPMYVILGSIHPFSLNSTGFPYCNQLATPADSSPEATPTSALHYHCPSAPEKNHIAIERLISTPTSIVCVCPYLPCAFLKTGNAGKKDCNGGVVKGFGAGIIESEGGSVVEVIA